MAVKVKIISMQIFFTSAQRLAVGTRSAQLRASIRSLMMIIWMESHKQKIGRLLVDLSREKVQDVFASTEMIDDDLIFIFDTLLLII